MAKKKGFIQEFKEFISRGSVMDLAVGVIIGAAFTAIVNSLVNDIITPLIELITGDGMTGLRIPLPSGSFIELGAFISAIINFLLIALVVFLLVKAINGMRRKEPEAAPPRLCPYCKTEIADDATRCPHCTSVLTEDAQVEKVASTSQS